MIRLIIYDLDGTLIDSRRDIAEAVNGTLEEFGLPLLTLDEVSSFVGSGVRNLMTQALEACSLLLNKREGACALPAVDRTIKVFRRLYAEHLLDHTCLYPWVPGVLERFKDRMQAVVTNKPEDLSRTILKGLGVDRYFCELVGGDAGFPKKPVPEPLLEILRRAAVKPEEAVLVGDSAIDIETGRNAGVTTFAVTYGFGRRREIESARPDYILKDLEELIRCPLLQKV